MSYLAIPPALFDDVIQGLARVGLHHEGRVVVEKPFGRDTANANELNEIINRTIRMSGSIGSTTSWEGSPPEPDGVPILEHRAGAHMEPPFRPGVQITMSESFGVEGRGAFYDSVGAIRDVVQNHLLVVMSMLAMEPPVSDDPEDLRNERVKVLKAIRPLNPKEVVTGQYAGYTEEPGVEPASSTETFFAGRFEIDSWRWAGVPWIIRAGKALDTTITEAVVEFLRPPRLFFGGELKAPEPNRIYFQSKPRIGSCCRCSRNVLAPRSCRSRSTSSSSTERM